MCSTYFDEGSIMEKYNQGQGDLADILRPTTNRVRSDSRRQAASTTIEEPAFNRWFPVQHDDPVMHREEVDDYDFGDPFSNMKDPLLHELELVIPGNSLFFGSSISEDSAINPVDDRGFDLGGNRETYPIMSAPYAPPPIPSPSPQQDPSTSVAATPIESLERPLAHIEEIDPNSRGRSIDTTTAMQVSARNSSMKRRKVQAKKVVCIPAPPATVNGRTGGEVVPSDLWAWRKYGQKPIKGSPHPRSYYRCSSSKGCSARKQVERSRTDPNMLVITYTSEHNHPWPTQRNVLAGSTRATQSSNKNNSGSNVAPKVSSSSSPRKDQQQRRDKRPNDDAISTNEAVAGGGLGAYIKEENERSEEGAITGLDRCRRDDDGDDDDDFLFQDLEGMDGGSDPLSFLLNQGGPGENSRPKSDTAGSDSFGNFFDWMDFTDKKIDFDW